MIVDEIKIKISAGKGGDGIVSFKNNKYEKGPTGGDGGNGGNVYLEGVSDLTALNKFRFKKEFSAPKLDRDYGFCELFRRSPKRDCGGARYLARI